MRSIYDGVVVSPSARPQVNTGTTGTTGLVIDTKGRNTAMIIAYGTVASGAPTAATLACKLEECATETGTFAAANDNGGTQIQVSLTLTSADAIGLARIEALGTTRLRYLRLVTTPAFTGGTNPAFTSVAVIALDRSYQDPVRTTVSNT